jgi:hypothetical protein
MSKWTDMLSRNVGKKLPIHAARKTTITLEQKSEVSRSFILFCVYVYILCIILCYIVHRWISGFTQWKRTLCRVSKSLRLRVLNAILTDPHTIIFELSSLQKRRALNAIVCTLPNKNNNKRRLSWLHQARNNILLHVCKKIKGRSFESPTLLQHVSFLQIWQFIHKTTSAAQDFRFITLSVKAAETLFVLIYFKKSKYFRTKP